MTRPLILVCLLAWVCPVAAQERRGPASPWERSVVSIEVSRKQHDYYQPWSPRTSRAQKTGLVVGDREILTTADELFDRTLVRVQKEGRGRWWTAQATWIDYHANLALVTTAAADGDFWEGLKPATLGGAIPPDGTLQILRWRNGNLENRRAEFTRFNVREGQLAAVSHVVLEADTDMQGAGWSEVVVANSHAVGLVASQDNRACAVIPASFIQSILKARSEGRYAGLGYLHFYWQSAQNPAALARLGVSGEPRGVIVAWVPPRPDGGPQVLKAQDVILQIDGFDLDIQGDYQDPEYGHLMLENLATRKKWAGEELPMKIWRDGRQMDVTYRLPRYEYTNSLVPFATYDQEPEYMVVGGLVFQPLSDSYLQSWGAEWRRRSPFRLYHYRSDLPTKDRPGLVLLSQVLPDEYNIGYQDQKGLVVDKVNGRTIGHLADLRDALSSATNGFHIIEFMKSDSLRKLVLDAGQAEREATARVLERYGIKQPWRLAAASPAPGAAGSAASSPAR